MRIKIRLCEMMATRACPIGRTKIEEIIGLKQTIDDDVKVPREPTYQHRLRQHSAYIVDMANGI